MKKLLILSIIAGIFTGCAQNYYVAYDRETTSEAGNLEIALAEPGYTTVLIDDREIDSHTGKVKKVTISELPTGIHKIDVSVGSEGANLFTKQDSIRIYPDQTSTMIVNNPSNQGKYLLQLLVTATAGYLIASLITGGL